MKQVLGKLVACAVLLVGLVAGSLLMTGCGAQRLPDPPPIPVSRPVNLSEFFGVNVMFTLYERDQYRQQIKAIEKLGVRWIRLGLHWLLIEPEPGKKDYSKLDDIMQAVQEAGLETLISVYGPPKHRSRGKNSKRPDQYPPDSDKEYADLLVELAQRYPHVKAWQIWNEPNLRAFWQPKDDPEAYSELVKTTVKRMRTAEPDKTLVLGGMAYWSVMQKRGGLMLDELQKLGVFKLVDAIAYHPYLRTPYGDKDRKNPYNFITTGLWLNDAARKQGARSIWATEWGWGSYHKKKKHDEVVSEEQQAEYTLQRLVLMMAMGFDKIFYFSISDLPDYVPPPHRDSGLLYIDGRPKPVYTSLARFLKLLPGTLQPAKAPQVEGETGKRVWGFAWKTGDGRKVWIAWADQPGQVQIKSVRSVRVHELVSGRDETVEANAGSVRIQLGPAPVVVELR